MLIAVAPALLKAARIAMLFWVFATHGEVRFQEVRSCSVAEAVGAPCISVNQAKDVGRNRVGATWKYDNQYIVLVQDANNEAVLAHEFGHVLIGMRYHAAENTSILSPVMGKRCLTAEDSAAYLKRYPERRALELRCL